MLRINKALVEVSDQLDDFRLERIITQRLRLLFVFDLDWSSDDNRSLVGDFISVTSNMRPLVFVLVLASSFLSVSSSSKIVSSFFRDCAACNVHLNRSTRCALLLALLRF